MLRRMKFHLHTSVEDVILTGIMAVVFIDVTGLLAAHMAKRDGVIGTVGKSLGAVIPFKG